MARVRTVLGFLVTPSMKRKRLVTKEAARTLLLGLIFALSCIMLHHPPAAADTRPGRSLSGVVEKDPISSPRYAAPACQTSKRKMAGLLL